MSKKSAGSTANPSRLAAVPCQGDDVLVLLDLETGDQRGTIPVGSHPVHATHIAGTTVVATMGERSVTAIRPNGSVERIEIGVLGPSHFATCGDELFVSCTAGDVVAVIDPAAARLTDRIAVGAEPHELAVDTRRDTVLVGTRRGGTVDLVSTVERRVVASIDAGPDARVQGVTLAPDGTRGYAVDQAGARVFTFDPEVDQDALDRERASDRTPTEQHPIDRNPINRDPIDRGPTTEAVVGANPYDLVVTDMRVLVPGRDDGTVHAFAPDLTLETVHDEFARPVDLFHVDGTWWVLDAAASTIQSLDGRVVDAGFPGRSAIVVDGRLLVSHYDDDRVSLIDLEQGPRWQTSVPAHPFGAIVL